MAEVKTNPHKFEPISIQKPIYSEEVHPHLSGSWGLFGGSMSTEYKPIITGYNEIFRCRKCGMPFEHIYHTKPNPNKP